MSMYVSYDPEARATYVELLNGDVARALSLSDLVMVDLDDANTVLGIEFATAPRDIEPWMIGLVVDRFLSSKNLPTSTDGFLQAAETPHWRTEPPRLRVARVGCVTPAAR